MSGDPSWLWEGGGVCAWAGVAEGDTDWETALRLAKNPILPFKLAMKSRERGGVGREAGLISG